MPATPSPILSLSGKVAIVTGASRGIGAEVAYELAKRGARVAITYTSKSSKEQVQDLIQRIDALENGSAAAMAIQDDLRDADAPQRIVSAVIAKRSFYLKDDDSQSEPHIDILVNNAGCELVKPLGAITPADFASVYDLNVRAALLMTQAILPHLGPRSRIVNLSSVGARCGFANLSVYCSSKAALEGLTRCCAAELGKDGHTVNAVSPGPTQTEMMDNIPKELVAMQKSQTPVENRVGTVGDVAQVVCWLCEEGSRWVSGQVINASGGWTMY